MIQRASDLVTNKVALAGHVRANPIVQADNPVWPLSVDRAQQMRSLLNRAGMLPDRIRRVTGHADRSPLAENPMALRNNRIEVILLRH